MARTVTLDFVTTYHLITCCSCGQSFAVDQGFYAILKRDGSSFYCPVGHPQSFTDTTAARLQKAEDDLVAERQRREWSEKRAARLREERDAAERSRNAIKGQVTKLRKRLTAGVCPYCTRHFAALERHIASKHPGRALPAESVEEPMGGVARAATGARG